MAKKCKVVTNKSGVIKIEELERKGTNVLIKCKCPLCGKEFTMWRSHFYRGSNSCKCVHPRSERLYSIWTNMKTRCYNSNTPNYNRYYGIKGITICEEWRTSYKTFEKWALENGYRRDLTIDRIDNSEGYCPENCRWATRKQQTENRTNAIKFNINGVNTPAKTCSDNIKMDYKSFMNYYYKHGKQATEKMIKNKLGGCDQ